jgi:hypothetical protein
MGDAVFFGETPCMYLFLVIWGITCIKPCGTSDSHSGIVGDTGLTGCHPALLGYWFPTFRNIAMPLYLNVKQSNKKRQPDP